MQELVHLRKPRAKYYKRENGIIDLQLFDEDVHYMKNGHYENIDNTWIEEKNYYYNKSNAYHIYLNKKKDDELVKMKSGMLEFSISLSNKLPIMTSSQFEKVVSYENILKNIDIIYEFVGNRLKDNIILKDIDHDFEHLNFLINNLDVRLENGALILEKNQKFVCKLAPPTLKDNQHKSYPINYILDKYPDGYRFHFEIADNILKNKDLYPLIIDPILTSDEEISVKDTYIYEGDENTDRNNTDLLKVGVDENNKIYRTLLKFNLPDIGTGCDIVRAKATLVSHVDDYEFGEGYKKVRTISVHEMNTDWQEESANWQSLHDKYNNEIEDYFDGARTLLKGHYPNYTAELKDASFDITNLVKRWYAGVPNYGVMLKFIDETFELEAPHHIFYSKNNTVTETTNPKPFLIISYRNQNGLENYMTYHNIDFQDGSSNINNLTGNLTNLFALNQTIGGKWNAHLNLVYNTNDVVLHNDYGYGLGYKLNYHQIITEIKIDDLDYLEYLDEDGTKHYFYKVEDSYQDEDGLNLTITKEDNTYILKDKNKNQMYFKKIGDAYYLQKMMDNRQNTITIEYNNQKISKIIDANQQVITVTYQENKITTSSNYKMSLVTLENGQMRRLTTQNGHTNFYYQNQYLTKIEDTNGKSIAFRYYDTIPYRLRKITEFGLNGEEGNHLEYTYGFQVTRVKDHKGRVQTYSFNKQGNTVGITNLKKEDDFVDAYGNYKIYDDTNEASKNKLLLDSGGMKYTNNLFLEREKSITGTENLTLPKFNKSGLYTISALFKTNQDNVTLQWLNNHTVLKSISIPKRNEYQKYSMTVEVDLQKQYELKITASHKETITNIKELQLEKGDIANYYNLIKNSDFQNGLTAWTVDDATDTLGNNLPNDDKIVTLSNGEKAYYRKSYYNQSKALSQIIPVSGKKNDTYRLSFWYKNNGIREDGMFAGHIVTMGFDYTNEVQSGTQMHNLNIHGTEWQFFNMTFTTKEDYDKIRISIISQTEVNDLYMTHFTLTKDIGFNSYNYDEDGNLISAINQNKQSQTFHYDSNNQLISSFEPKGNHFKFEYDNQSGSMLLQGLSTKGIANKIQYDEFENPIKTIIQKKASQELENHSFYIRKKGTNLYIKPQSYQNSIILQSPRCNKESFTFNKLGDYYTIKSTTTQKYITITNEIISLSQEAKITFELLPNQNGSYSIKHSEANAYLTSIGNYFELRPFEKDNFNQQFYFEPTNQEKRIETNAEYTPDGRFLTKSIDPLGKITQYDIDKTKGLTKQITDALGLKTNYEYNGKEQITKVNKEDKTIEYFYNDQNLLSKISCNNKDYHFFYDAFLNPKNVKINNHTLITNEYEENNGNLSKIVYGNQDSISYTYDDLDRLKTLQKDKTYHHFYNNQNELVKITSEDEIYQYYYDFAGRIQKYLLNNDSIEYDYDINSNVLSKKFFKNNKSYQINYTYDEDDSIIKVTFDNQELNYTYDELGRLTKKSINNQLPIEYEYYSNGNKTSLILKSIKINEDVYEYLYDNLYNIKTIYKNKKLLHEYFYDNFSELIKENNYQANKTYQYIYDSSGNILKKKEYELNTDNLLHQSTYEYQNENWQDQLTKFNDIEITYDEIGNPLTIGDMNLAWQNGRELKSITSPTKDITYTYNKDGIRKSKTINNITTNYFTENSTLIFEETNNNMLYFIRDDNNNLLGFKYNDILYYYQKNTQEDITGIYDKNYQLIATYEYDSWGKILNIKDNLGNDISNNPSHIANINPFRYRSYYYDSEINLYYLNSRYYNPEWGRFINVDEITGEIGNVLSHNLYQYAFNNPISFRDDEGSWPNIFKAIGKIAVGVAVIAVGAAVAASVGTVASVGTAIVAGVKAAASVAVVSAGIKTTKSIIQSGVRKETPKKTLENVVTSAVNGFTNGFVTGSVLSSVGIAATVVNNGSAPIHIGNTDKTDKNRVELFYGKTKNDKNKTSNTTLFAYNNRAGSSRFRIETDETNFLHMHYGRTWKMREEHRKGILETIFGIISGLM